MWEIIPVSASVISGLDYRSDLFGLHLTAETCDGSLPGEASTCHVLDVVFIVLLRLQGHSLCRATLRIHCSLDRCYIILRKQLVYSFVEHLRLVLSTHVSVTLPSISPNSSPIGI